MARKCDVCGKGTMFGNKVSHSKNHTRRTWFPNLQKVRTKIEGTAMTVKICTSCLKAGKVVKAV